MDGKNINIACKGSDLLSIDKLSPFQGDLKILSDQNYNKLKKEILELGFSEPISVWQNNGNNYILNGHQRLKTLQNMKSEGYEIPEIPVNIIQAENIKQAKLKLLALTSQYGEIKPKGLFNYMQDANISLDELEDDFRFPEVDFKYFSENYFTTPDDEIKDPDQITPTTKPITKLGDIWQLGKHKLICGDCTKQETYNNLLNNGKVDLTFTSSPYNTKNLMSKYRGENIVNKPLYLNKDSDFTKDSDHFDLLENFIANCLNVSNLVIFNYQLHTHNKIVLIDFLNHFKNQLCDIAIWYKSNYKSPIAAPKNMLRPCFEFLFIFCKEPQGRVIPIYDFKGTIDNVYVGCQQNANKFSNIHAATFPLHLPTWIVRNFTNIKNEVLDPFVGTGTTLIACEQINRICYGIEIEPVYCDVTVKRWENLTNQKAKLL